MSNAVQRHLHRFPKARTTTLAHLEKRAEMTERLKKEIAAEKRDRNKLFLIIKRTGLWPAWIWR